MAQKNYEKLLTELMKKIPQNRLVKHLFLNYTIGKGGNEFLVINKICKRIFGKPANREEDKADTADSSTFDPVYDRNSCFIDEEKDINIDWEAVFNPELINEDFRIAKISFENFRKFPGKGDNQYPYGVSFKYSPEDENPCSAIILGVNGVGKSSVYQGIEYIYRKEIGEARLRDYGKREDTEAGKFKRYMSNWTCNDVNVKMWVNGSQKEFTNEIPLQAEQGVLSNCLKYGFFISEYEVIRLGQMKIEHGGHDSLRMQITNALDMGELNWLNRLVYKLAIYQSNIKVEENISSEEIDAKRDTIKRNNEFFTHIDFLMNLKPGEQSLKNFLYNLPEVLTMPDVNKTIEHANKIIHLASIISEFTLSTGKKNISDTTPIGVNSERKIITQLDNLVRALNNIHELREKIDAEIKYIKDSLPLQNLRFKDEYIHNILKQIDDDFYNVIDHIQKDKDNAVPITISGLNALKNNCREILSFITMELIPTLPKWEKERNELIGALQLSKIIETYNTYSSKELINRVKENDQLAKEIHALELAQKEYQDRISQYNLIQCIKQDAYQIYKIINKKISSKLQEEVSRINRDIIQNIMSHFLSEDEELIWTWDNMLIKEENGKYTPATDSKENKYLACMIQDKTSGSTISVKKHFNTFRFHLFNTILNMAFSFAVMEKLKVKLPIMLDDIFYASDFHNRRNIKHFVKAILTAYKSIFENGKDNSEQPDKIGSKLQLVIFTHDELVFKSITDEIKEFHKNDYRKYFMFHSLLPHKEAAPDSNFEISNLVFNLNERNDE